jgi:acetyl-CoA C-acetyltransferase
MDDIVIVSAARTPVGSFNGALGSLPAHQLGTIAIKAAVERAKLDAAEVDEAILGQVLPAGQGMNPARQAARGAGLPDSKTAFGINQVCGSGLRAVALAAQQVRTGESAVVVAGGMESMSQSQHAAYLRGGVKMGGIEFTDTMIKDGLWDAFHGYHMGNTAENVAHAYQITREEQDRFALASQDKASRAQKEGRFKDEIVAVTVKGRKGDTVVAEDEYIRHDASIESMAKLRPAFTKDGTVTAGNASGINDGAAALVIMTAAEAAKRGLKPLARIAAFATAGVDPAVMGTGPIPATRKVLGRAGWKTSVGIPPRSTSTAAPLPSAIRSAPPARASSLRCCMKCRSETPSAVSPLSASEAAWASPCASSVNVERHGRRRPAIHDFERLEP